MDTKYKVGDRVLCSTGTGIGVILDHVPSGCQGTITEVELVNEDAYIDFDNGTIPVYFVKWENNLHSSYYHVAWEIVPYDNDDF